MKLPEPLDGFFVHRMAVAGDWLYAVSTDKDFTKSWLRRWSISSMTCKKPKPLGVVRDMVICKDDYSKKLVILADETLLVHDTQVRRYICTREYLNENSRSTWTGSQ